MSDNHIRDHAPKLDKAAEDAAGGLAHASRHSQHTARMSRHETSELVRVSRSDSSSHGVGLGAGDGPDLATAESHGVETAEVPTVVQERLVRSEAAPQTRPVGKFVVEGALDRVKEDAPALDGEHAADGPPLHQVVAALEAESISSWSTVDDDDLDGLFEP